jgi:hypothetical protein
MRKLPAVLGILVLLGLAATSAFWPASLAPASAQDRMLVDSPGDDREPSVDHWHGAHRRVVRAAELAFDLAPGQTRQLPLPPTRRPITVTVAASHTAASNGQRGVSNVVYVAPDPTTGKLWSISPLINDPYSPINDFGPGGTPFDGIQIENRSAEQNDPQTISYQVSIWW